jgi:hypothetical protein
MFIIMIDDGSVFTLEGKIVLSNNSALFHDANGTRIYKRTQVIAIMRSDFAQEYEDLRKELARLKGTEAEQN